MPPHLILTCAAGAGDIQNARDRPQPVGQSSTAPCGASHFATAREPSTMGAKSSVEKKVLPAGQTTCTRAPPSRGVLGRTLVQPEPSGAARYGCHTLPEARSEAWAWGLGARGSQAWFWPPRPI